MMQDPLLSQYSVLILDEVHERNVNTDIIIGLLKKVLKKRPSLKVIVCSATVDADEIKLFFDENKKKQKRMFTTNATPINESSSISTTIVSIEGRYYPIEIAYLTEPCDNYIKAAVTTAFAIHITQADIDGDILIFLTGQDDVDLAVNELIEKATTLKETTQKKPLKKLWILPLHGSLPVKEQLKVNE
jgi:ATP-dependent RNA helicase DDX35